MCGTAAWASYRYWLDHMLHAGGIPFIYAGSRTGAFSDKTVLVGPPNKYPDYDPHNDGYSGAMAWAPRKVGASSNGLSSFSLRMQSSIRSSVGSSRP